MEIRQFDDIEAFVRRVSPHLQAHEAEHNLELGILDSIRAGRYDGESPLLVSVEDNDAVSGIMIRTPPHGLLLSAKLPLAGAETAAAWLLESGGRSGSIPGVQAESTVATAFVDAWHRRKRSRMAVYRNERIYRLSSVRSPAQEPAGGMRALQVADRSLLVEWFGAFAVTTGDPDPIDPQAAVDRLIAGRSDSLGLYIWERDGRPRSMAGHGGPTPHGMRVGPVYTPQEERRQGYAGAVVAALSQRLLDHGREFCFLFTDLANPTSNHIYQEIGYEPVCDVTQYRVIGPG